MDVVESFDCTVVCVFRTNKLILINVHLMYSSDSELTDGC